MATDITNLTGKVENSGTSAKGKVSAAEWNQLIGAVIANQNPVKKIKMSTGEEVLPDENGLVTLPNVDSSLRYIAKLQVERTNNKPIVTIHDDYTLNVRFSSIASDSEGRVNTGADGTLVIARRTSAGDNYVQVGTMTLSSRNEDSDMWDEVDLGQYMVDGWQQISLTTSFIVRDIYGNVLQNVNQSAPIVYEITKTSLAMEYKDTMSDPWNVSGGLLRFKFGLSGIVDRTLHVRVTGSTGVFNTTYVIASGEFNNPSVECEKTITITDSYGITSHGVKTIEAWLTCSDGITADSIEGEHINVQRMVVTDYADREPKLLLRSMATKVQNYVGTTLCEYMLYSPTTGSAMVSFVLTDFNETTEYYNVETNVEYNKLYTLPATVEIENADDDELFVYFNAYDSKKKSLTKRVGITVDNSFKFTPTLGADFLLNPKTRNNTESNPFTIVNAMTGDEVGATFEGFDALGDLWIQSEDNQRVLRILAGEKLTINYDWLSAFSKTNTANVTMEIDYKVSNITETEEPIFTACENYSDSFIGIQMRPMELMVNTKNSKTYEAQNLHLAEDTRIHLSINIISSLKPESTSDKVISVCRVFADGVIDREFTFDATTKDWYEKGSKLVFGHKHADIDIYSLRVYKTALSASQIVSNRISALPTAEEKVRVREENDILDAGTNLVSYTKVTNERKKNSFVFHGDACYQNSSEAKYGWAKITRYSPSGEYLPQFSGTICKETKTLPDEGQGTTAKTYFYFNDAFKFKNITGMIWVALEDIHSDIVVIQNGAVATKEEKSKGIAVGDSVVLIYGGNLGKNDWSSVADTQKNGAQTYKIENGKVYVYDGWIDGNKMYRGRCYKLSDTSGYAIKPVAKINYASSMQSHLMGANNAYNDLHTAVVGATGIQLFNPKARICKEQLPFMYFIQTDKDKQPVYRGGATFGPAKMDDSCMGFDKKQFPYFCMLEGADNNGVLTDFRTPWDKTKIGYKIKDGEADGYTYNGTTMFDLDKFVGVTKEYQGANCEVPREEIEDRVIELVNFIYKHNPRIKVFSGTWDKFVVSESAQYNTYQWWVTEGVEAKKLKRYDEAEGAWLDAGWNENTNSVSIIRLDDLYPSAFTTHQGDWEAINKDIIHSIAMDAKEHLPEIMNVESLKFHYNFVQRFLAGSDNNSKNTYYLLVPDGKGGWIWVLYQDDLDTIFKTDNNGFQNKPYYIERLFSASDLEPTASLYQGMANVLFDLEEAMYEESGENKEMMRKIFNAMSTISGNPWKFLDEYFFSIQRWFPAVAYNEQARLRYEYPESIGYTSKLRNIRPISQSAGDQIHAETQYMKQRLILFASYAQWGDFDISTSTTGLSDAVQTLVISGKSENRKIQFKGLVPHQYIYIGGQVGTTPSYLGVRCKPNEKYDFDLTKSIVLTGDTGAELYGANYFRSFGNLGDMEQKDDADFTITARRLTDITINPSGESKFNPTKLIVNSPLVEKIDVSGSGIKGNLDVSSLIRLRSINTENTPIGTINYPETRLLSDIAIGANCINLAIRNLSNLENFSIQGFDKLMSVEIKNTPFIDTYTLMDRIYKAQPKELEDVKLDGVKWSGVAVALLLYVTDLAKRGNFKGAITMRSANQDRYITLQEKLNLVNKFGNIDSVDNDLYIKYDTKAISTIGIYGKTFPYEVGDYQYEVVTSPVDANDIAINEDGSMALEWSLPTSANQYGKIDKASGVLTTTSASADSEDLRQDITLKMVKMDGTELTATKNIAFYRRIPQLGDFAYGDGVFDSVWDSTRDFVGLVFKKATILEDDVVTGYDLRITTLNNITANSKQYNRSISEFMWGLDLVDTSPSAEQQTEIRNATGLLSLTDFPSISNRTSFSGSVNDAYMVDEAQEDGFISPTNTNDIRADFRGKENTETIVSAAQKIITLYYGKELPQTLDKFADLYYTISNEGLFTKLLYPQAYAAYLYEPSHKRELIDEYKSTHWYLPASGEIVRILFYYAKGTTTDKANFEEGVKSKIPIFANAAYRSQGAVGFTARRALNSLMWGSSSEYSSHQMYVNGTVIYIHNYAQAQKGFTRTILPVAQVIIDA